MKIKELDPKNPQDMEWLKSFRSNIKLANKAIVSDAKDRSEMVGSKAYPVDKMKIKVRGRGPRPNKWYYRELPLDMARTWAIYLVSESYKGTSKQQSILKEKDQELFERRVELVNESKRRSMSRIEKMISWINR